MKIMIPQSYSIISSYGTSVTGAALHNAISTGQTYKSAGCSAAGGVTVDQSGQMAVLISGAMSIAGAVSSPTGEDRKALWLGVGSDLYWTSASNASIVNLSVGTVYDFPNLPAAQFNPQRVETRYSNTISVSGEYIGRSVVRKSRGVSIKPLSFSASSAQWDDLNSVMKGLRSGPAYFLVDGPSGLQHVYYGWTEQEPSTQYNGDVDQMTIQIDLRMTF